jgi:hypothetical protein
MSGSACLTYHQVTRIPIKQEGGRIKDVLQIVRNGSTFAVSDLLTRKRVLRNLVHVLFFCWRRGWKDAARRVRRMEVRRMEMAGR